MEVVVPASPTWDFQFNTMNLGSPTTPKPFGKPVDYFYQHASAPTSPRRAAAIYAHFSNTVPSSSTSPMHWDENAGDHGNELLKKTRPTTRPVSRSPDQSPGSMGSSSPQSSSTGRRERQQRAPSTTLSSGSGRPVSIALSSLRGEPADFHSDHSTSTSAKGGRSKGWKLRDLLLFRSASDGHATGRESKVPLRFSSSSLNKSSSEKNQRKGSFESIERETMGGVESEENVKKTSKKPPLAYHRYGLFGYLRFNPAVHNSSVFSRMHRT